jgi:hypothetical protein
MRVELPDGQWAELHEHISHADDKAIKRLTTKAKTDEAVWFDVDSLIVRTFLRDWYVKDRDGQPIPATDADAVERAPSDIIDRLAIDGSKLYTGATDTNPTPASSDDSSSATP